MCPTSASPNAPTPPPLGLRAVNADVHSVHLPSGQHVGNLKRIGAVWKFKAVGYSATGAVEPGGGPLTAQHNTVFAVPDASAVAATLGPCLPGPGA